MLITSRRSFLAGLVSALAAPAIVHATNIMPVRNVLILPAPTFDSFDHLIPDGTQYQWVSWPSRFPVDAFADLGQSVNPRGGSEESWRPVPASRYSGRFAGTGGIIKVGDCVLVERPKDACVAARNKEIQQAKQLVKNWADRCMANGFEGGVRYSVVDEGYRYRTISELGKVA